MSKVSISNPNTGEERQVASSTLGPWRRKGWVLTKDMPQDKPVPEYLQPLPDMTESVVEEPEEEA